MTESRTRSHPLPVLLGQVLLGVVGALPLLAAPSNDNFADRTKLTGDSGRVTASSADATKELGEPAHAANLGGRSVWWTWTAPIDGTATFNTTGSTFDTLLAIYVGSSVENLVLIEEDDDGGAGLTSYAVFTVEEGARYQIAVDGFDGESGSIVLSWFVVAPCGNPPAAVNPWPPDGAGELPVDTVLEWNRPQPARLEEVIYGNDDRLDLYQVANPDLLKVAESTVGLVSRSALRDNGDTYTLVATTLQDRLGLCDGEPFGDQPSVVWCSGFLVAESMVVTAGHCMETFEDCLDVAIVFGYRMLDADTPVLTFPKSEVYFCGGIVGSQSLEDGRDWAVVQLDRGVPDREPLRIRRAGSVPAGQDLILIGHPVGLPVKVAGGARVRNNLPQYFFEANLDAYGGNSGSAVVNADTFTLEGILVAGEEDFVWQDGCLVSNRCPDAGCEGEAVSRSTNFAHLVPANPSSVSYQVYFGSCDRLELQGQTAGESWQPPGLEDGNTYCWRIVTVDECGTSQGPIWSFTTGAAGPLFTRGNTNADSKVDISDAVVVLGHLFLGAPPVLSCQTAADFDDSNVVDITDAITLLQFLFLGGHPPQPPYPFCGPDLTPGGLSCASFPPCE